MRQQREAVFAEMGVAIKEDGETVGFFQPKAGLLSPLSPLPPPPSPRYEGFQTGFLAVSCLGKEKEKGLATA